MLPTKDISNTENGRDLEIVQPKKSHSQKTLHIDEAISRTGFGLFNLVIICLGGLILFAVGMETCAIAYVLPVSKCDLDLTTTQKGVLAGSAFFGVICSSHLWGFLADTKGRRRIILPTLFITFFLSVICSLVQSFYIFTILRFFSGFFISGSAANMFAYLGEFHNDIQRSRSIMGCSIFYSCLCIMLPLTSWLVINGDWQFQIPYIDLTYKPWRLFMVVISLPGLLSAMVLIILPESPKFVLSQGNKEATYQILQKMNRWNNGKNAQLDDFEINEEVGSIETRQRNLENKNNRFVMLKTIWSQTAPIFKPPYLIGTVLFCVIQFGIFAISQGFFMFFAEILNRMSNNLENFYDKRIMMCDVINMKSTNTTEIASDEVCITKLELSTLENGVILEIVFALGSLIGGLLINRVGKFPITFFVLFTTGLCGIGCMLIDIPALQIAFFVWHMLSAIASSVVSAAAVDFYPTTVRAMAMSISLTFGRIGGIAGSNLVALTLDNNCELTFYLSGSVLLFIAVLAFFLPNIHKKITSSDHPRPSIISHPRASIISFKGSSKGC